MCCQNNDGQRQKNSTSARSVFATATVQPWRNGHVRLDARPARRLNSYDQQPARTSSRAGTASPPDRPAALALLTPPRQSPRCRRRRQPPGRRLQHLRSLASARSAAAQQIVTISAAAATPIGSFAYGSAACSTRQHQPRQAMNVLPNPALRHRRVVPLCSPHAASPSIRTGAPGSTFGAAHARARSWVTFATRWPRT